jgi:hypothetical protein
MSRRRQKLHHVTHLNGMIQEAGLQFDVLKKTMERTACIKEARPGRKIPVLHVGGKTP